METQELLFGKMEAIQGARRDKWQGFDRLVFDFRGHEAWVVAPRVPAVGRPWTWTMQWADAFVPRTGVPALLGRGFHHAVLQAFETRAEDAALPLFRAFQDFIVDGLELAPKARLVGLSWGGFFSVRYAAAFPEAVERIYLDAPLLTFDGFSLGHDIGPWAASEPAGGWAGDPRMPVYSAGALARAGIPVFLVYGGSDVVVPPALNAEAFLERFKAAGGAAEVIARPSFGHHPHGLDDPAPIVSFMEGGAARDLL